MKLSFWLSTTALLGLLAVPAWAADAAATTDAAGTPTQADADIIVTAQKRAEWLQTVPIAISVYTPESRDRIGILSLSDYANFTPGLSYAPGSDRVFVRGVGRQTNTVGSDAGVATYSDGVYNASTASVAGDTLFVQRTEILRGPQGTLYGRNSIGGAINTISRRPTDDFYAEGRATIGNYDLYGGEAAVSGPLSKGIRVRLAGLYSDQGDGYFKNTAGPDEGGRGHVYYVEGQAEVDFAPRFDGWVKLFTGGSTTHPHPSQAIDAYDYSRYPAGLVPGSAYGLLIPGVVQGSTGTTNPALGDRRDFSADTFSRARTHDNWGISGQLHYEGDGFDVRYIGGYQQYQFDSVSDIDQTSVKSYVFPIDPAGACAFLPFLGVPCSPATIYPSQVFNFGEDKKFSSHEINVASSGTGPFQWIVGAYYYHENYKQSSSFNAPGQLQLRAPANGPANPSGDYVTALGQVRTNSYAGFGQADYKVTGTLKLTAGLRYTEDRKTGFEQFRALCYGVPSCGNAPGLGPLSAGNLGTLNSAVDITSALISFAPAPGVAAPPTVSATTGLASRRLKDSWNALTGTAGIEYQPTADTLAYLRYSRGYKSGGFNTGAVSALPESDAEHVDAYEGGVKTRLGRTLTANAAAFYYDYKGLQVPLTVPVGGIPITSFVNVPKARSYGIELETLWTPVDNLSFLLSYGYLNAEIRKTSAFIDASAPTAGTTARGQNLPDSPRHKIALNGSYTLNFDPGSVTLSASYIWRARSYGYVFNNRLSEAPSSDQVDLRLLLNDKNDRFTAILFVRNLFDTLGYDAPVTVTGTTPAGPGRQVSLTPPRTFGAQLQFRFK